MFRSFAIVAVALSVCTAAGADWPSLRGPAHNGSAPDAKNLPVAFSATQNVAWSVDMPGQAAATPIVVGDQVYLSSVGDGDKLIAMAINAETGKVVWQHEVGQSRRKDGRSNMANPSPASDGKTVVFFYSSGEMVGFSPAGEKRWQRSITDDYGEFAFIWTFAASPIFHDGKLYLPVLQRDQPVRGKGSNGAKSFILVIDPQTGKTINQVIRPTKARGESMEAYTVVVPGKLGAKEVLMVAGGDAVTLHDARTARETWRWETYNPRKRGNHRLVATPVFADDILIVCAPQGDPTFAIQPGQSKPLWVSDDKDISSDVASPLYYMGNVYILNGDKQTLVRIDPKTGNAKWKTNVRGNKLRASPTGADGKIYMLNHNAEVFVVDAESGDLLATNKLDDSDQARSTIVADGEKLFIRTDRKLYCVTKP